MLKLFSSKVLLAGAATSVCLVPMSAQAQVKAGAETGSPEADQTPEITVTAQLRNESSQDVSVSLAAFSGEELNKFGATDTASLTTLTSGVVVSNILGGSVPTITIRGQGVGAASFFANQPNSAAINVDGVYLPSAIMSNFQIFDTERVEVLKGPQGTLYGRNTTAGTINFFSRKPTDTPEGFVQGTYSRWNTIRLEAGIGGPISEKVGYRLSGIYNYSDGDVVNTYRDPVLDRGRHRTNGTDRFAARAQLRFRPSDDTDILLNVHGGIDRSDSFHYQVLPLQQAGYLDSAGSPDLFAISPVCYNQYRPTAPTCLSGAQNINQTDTDGDNYRVNSNLEIPTRINAIGGSLQIEQSLGELTLNSITAYDRFTRKYYEDEDGGPLTELHVYFDEDFRHYSQEVRLTSADASAFRWIVGGFASRLEAEMKRQADYTGVTSVLLASGIPWNGIVYSNRIRETSLAAFAHTTYDLTDKLRSIFGLRYTYERKSINVTNANTIGNSPLFAPINSQNYTITSYRSNDVSRSKRFSNLSGKIGLEYRPNTDVLLYAHASRGFKSGGFPGSLGVTPRRLQPYRPEIADNGEIGAKTNFDGNRGRFNVAGFYTHVRDRLEFATSSDGSFVDFTNAASVEIKGVEAELGYDFPGQFNVQISGAYVDSKYKNFVDRGNGADYSSNRVPFAPSWTGNIQVEKVFKLGEDRLSLQTNANYSSKLYLSAENYRAVSAGSYATWNARAEYRFGGSGLSTAVFVRNITDSRYRAGGEFGVTGNTAINYGLRRSVGVEARYSW